MAFERSTMSPALSTPAPENPHPHKHLIRSAGILGLLTGTSRILGFLRDCLIAAAYGTSIPAQAFVVAFRIPNLLRDLVGEGAANSAFVPVLARTRALEGEASWSRLAQALWIRLLLGFLAISLLGVVAARPIVWLVAPGFRDDPQLVNLTVHLTRILFPFIGLTGIAAFFMGLLNSVNRFTLPALGPVVLNISMISGFFLYRPDALGLSCGVIAGGFLQLFVQWPGLKKAGVRLRMNFASHPGVREIGRLLIPRVIGTGVYQVSVLVDTVFASFQQLVGAGGIASLYYAHRFLHLPLALFGISVAQVALPTMATQAAAEDLTAIRKTCTLALRSSLLVALPASVGLIVLGQPIIQTLLERGAFTSQATVVTVATLQWYALGLASLCATKVLANTLYAFHDTWTPVRSAAMALAANVALNFLLVFPMGLPGLALATSLSSTWNSFHLYLAVHRKIGRMEEGFSGWLWRVLLACLGMALVAFGVWSGGISVLGISHQILKLAWLLLSIGMGAASFFLLGLLLRVEEAVRLFAWAFRKN